MNRTFDPWANPGDLLRALLLEDWIVAEISDATSRQKLPEPLIESRRRLGIQSLRTSRVSVSARSRTAK